MSTSAPTSTSTSAPSTQPELRPQPDLTSAYQNFTHYAALGFLFGAPIIIALPPRKLDLYTYALGGGFVLSANHLLSERESRRRTSKSPFGGDPSATTGGPAAARADNGANGVNGNKTSGYESVQSQLRREKEDANRTGRLLDIAPDNSDNVQQEQQALEREEGEQQGRRPRSAVERSLQKVWMGDEKPGWKQRRLAEEQEKISRGEGYGSMIVDQLWEVWNWGREKGEELEEKDREVLRERKEKATDSRRAEEFPKVGKHGERG